MSWVHQSQPSSPGLRDDALTSSLQVYIVQVRRHEGRSTERIQFFVTLLTVIALSNAILDPATFSKVRDPGPVLVRVGMRTESTAGGLGPGASGTHGRSVLRAMHFGGEVYRMCMSQRVVSCVMQRRS